MQSFSSFLVSLHCIYYIILTVAFVTKYNPSCPTVSTEGELFMIVFTLDIGRRSSFIFADEDCADIVSNFDKKLIK